MMAAEATAMPSCPRRPASSRPSSEPPPTSSSCQTAEATNAPRANNPTASQDRPAVPAGRPSATAENVITVAGLTAVSPTRAAYARPGLDSRPAPETGGATAR